MRASDVNEPSASRMQELDRQWKAQRVLPELDRRSVLWSPQMRAAIKERPLLRERVRRIESFAQMRSSDTPSPEEDEAARDVFVLRSMPPLVMIKTYTKHKEFYDRLGVVTPREDPSQVQASVVLISGCQDDQGAADLGCNGLFTWMLKQVWSDGAFRGDHHRFHEDIRLLVGQWNRKQCPNFYLVGPVDEVFIAQRPFTVR